MPPLFYVNHDLRRTHIGLAVHLAQAAELDVAGPGGAHRSVLGGGIVRPRAPCDRLAPLLAVLGDVNLVILDPAVATLVGAWHIDQTSHRLAPAQVDGE